MFDRIESWPPRWRTTALFLTTGIVTLVATGWRVDLSAVPIDRNDGFHYAQLALGAPGESILAPFRNRTLTPWVVAALPVPVPWGFAIVTSVAAGATVAIMDRLLRLWFPARVAWFGLALVIVSPLLVNTADPFRVDPSTAAFAAATLLCLATHRWVWVCAVLPLAALNHELILVLLIPVMLTAWRERKLAQGAIVAGLSLVAWLVTHQSGWIVPVNDRGNLFDADHRNEMIRFNAEKYGSVAGALWAHFIGYLGIVGVLAPFGWRRAPQLLRDATWILVPCAIGVFTASDWGRLFIPALPVLVALSCAAIMGVVGNGSPTTDEPSHVEVSIEP